MRKVFRLFSALLFCTGLAFAESDLEQVIANLPESGEGVSVHIYENGFRLFSVGMAAIDDKDDAEAVLFAERAASLNARQALSEYFSQKLSGERAVSKAFSEAKSVNERNGEALETSRKYSLKEFSSEISTGTSTLMKGVATLKTIHATRGKHTYAKVLVCYTSSSLSSPNAVAVAVSSSRGEAKKVDEWISCEGRGLSRELAIQAALVEGVRQAYGTYLENDENYRSRFEKFKSEETARRLSAAGHARHTLTATKGFVDSYRIVKVELVQKNYVAVINALFVNPRAGGLKAIMLYPMEMPLDKEVVTYEVAPGMRMSGDKLGQVCSCEFEKAFTEANKYLVLNEEDMKAAVSAHGLAATLVGKGVASPAELAKAGKLLTADYIVRTSFENVSYARKVAFDKKRNKFIPKEHIALDFNYTMFDVKTAMQLKNKALNVILTNDEIQAVRSSSEELTEEEVSKLLFRRLLDKAVAALAEDAKF